MWTRALAFVPILAVTLAGCGRERPMPTDTPAPERDVVSRPREIPGLAALDAGAAEAPAAPGERARAREQAPPRAQPEERADAGAPDAAERAEAPARRPDVVFVPTPQPVVERMLELAKVTPKDLVYDLGCGDGRIVVTAAKRHGAKAVGFDIDPARVAEARENVRQNGVEHLVTIEQRDIFALDLSPASVVTLYLLPDLNVRLIPQLGKLRPGARVVSHDFAMEGVEPARHEEMRVPGESKMHHVYLWRAPIVARPTPAGSPRVY